MGRCLAFCYTRDILYCLGFHVLDTTPQLVDVLKQQFGYSQFRPGQQGVLDAALSGRDVIVLMPTGGGKSMCYQLPGFVLQGLVVVVSPLISLMQDQVAQCQGVGLRAALVNSAQAPEVTAQVYQDMHQERLDILFVAPERLLQRDFIQRLQALQIGLIAVDEAHCVSQWGHDFRQDYRRLGQLRQALPDIPMMALTATADLTTRADIEQQLNLHHPYIQLSSFDRPNIRYSVINKYKPLEQIKSFIRSQDGSGIIYCNSRKRVDEVSSKLKEQGYKVAPYHAGMESFDREYSQRLFQNDDVDVVVATVAFGMGINKSNVRYVIHYDLPRSIEGYYQETGRAGRDGLPAEAVLLFSEKDAARMQDWITQSDSPRANVELEKFSAMHRFAEAQTCRRQILLNYFAEFSADKCGNCDVCLAPPTHFPALEVAQKVLSCVYRMGMQGTANQVVDVLKGRGGQKAVEQGYNQLSTFGIGKDRSDEYWHNIIQQLVHLGYLRVNIVEYGALKLTEPSKEVLQGKVSLELAVPRTSVGKPVFNATQNYDKALFAKLKALRKTIADEHDIPPYVVFSDASLVDMAKQLPTTQFDFLQVNGVGRVKLDKYGDAFLHVIETHLTKD